MNLENAAKDSNHKSYLHSTNTSSWRHACISSVTREAKQNYLTNCHHRLEKASFYPETSGMGGLLADS